MKIYYSLLDFFGVSTFKITGLGLTLFLLISWLQPLPHHPSIALGSEEIKLMTGNLMEKFGIPGSAIAMIDNDKVEINCYGYSNLQLHQTVKEDTIFQLASISKTLTAWGVMKLVEKKVIRLSDPIRRHLKSYRFPVNSSPHEITIEHLLNHTSGLSLANFAGYSSINQLPSLKESLEGKNSNSEKLVQLFSPGQTFHYSGGGYCILQLLIEDCSQLPFQEYMKNEIFKPLDMLHSSFEFPQNHLSLMSSGYGLFKIPLIHYFFVEQAAAGLYSSISDMAKFVRENLKVYEGKSDLLQKDTFSQMLTSNHAYGLGYELEMVGQTLLAYHQGANQGWKSGLFLLPSKQAGLVILTNSDYGRHLIDELAKEWVIEKTNDIPPFYKEIAKERQIIATINFILFAIVMCKSILLLFYIISNRCIFCDKRKRGKTIAKMSFYLILGAIWLFVFYSPYVYRGGWMIAPFMPANFNSLSIHFFLLLLVLIVSTLFSLKLENSKK